MAPCKIYPDTVWISTHLVNPLSILRDCPLHYTLYLLQMNEDQRMKDIFYFSLLLIGITLCVIAQSCPTLCDPMDCSLWGSFVHGMFQARVLEWVAISFSKVSPSVQSSVIQSCPTLCDPMNCTMAGLPVHHQLLEFTHWLSNWTELNWTDTLV